jgi:hypothetical protein
MNWGGGGGKIVAALFYLNPLGPLSSIHFDARAKKFAAEMLLKLRGSLGLRERL